MAITTKSDFAPADRYLYDFKYCTYANGWAQVDTKQDASYYGTWTNPYQLKTFNYCEGDTYLTSCDTEDDYRESIRQTYNWNVESGYWKGIDPGFDPAMRQRFIDLGLEALLH